jgi:primase-polymerase (primpol)-like protein
MSPSQHSPQYGFDNLPDIPAIRELKKRPQWVAWRYATRKNGNGGTYLTKPPVKSA